MTLSKQRRSEQIKTGALQDAIFNSAYFSSTATDQLGVIQIEHASRMKSECVGLSIPLLGGHLV